MVGRAAVGRGRVEDVTRIRIGVAVDEVGGGVNLVARRWPLIVDIVAAVDAAVRAGHSQGHSQDDVIGRVVIAQAMVGVASKLPAASKNHPGTSKSPQSAVVHSDISGRY